VGPGEIRGAVLWQQRPIDCGIKCKLQSQIREGPLMGSRTLACQAFDGVWLIFVQISHAIASQYLRGGLDLLDKADLVMLIYNTSGVPLGANYNPQRFKLLFLDVTVL
jgi:hypothetical protein